MTELEVDIKKVDEEFAIMQKGKKGEDEMEKLAAEAVEEEEHKEH